MLFDRRYAAPEVLDFSCGGTAQSELIERSLDVAELAFDVRERHLGTVSQASISGTLSSGQPQQTDGEPNGLHQERR